MLNFVSIKNFIIYAVTTLALTKTVYSSGWAQFCDDDNCSVNCGIAVSGNNPGGCYSHCRNKTDAHNRMFRGART